jgi:hypothetical protein
MCEEARILITKYLDAVEEDDRSHLMLLAAHRTEDSESIEAYRGLLNEAKLKLKSARARFQEHQKVHNCSEVIHLEDDSS